jgi:subtilisin-like proprotein convertase family protein
MSRTRFATQRQTKPSRYRSFQPRLEALEDRVVPALMDFQSLQHNDASNTDHSTTYSEDGFQLTSLNMRPFASAGTLSPRYTGSTALYLDSNSGSMRLTRQGGGAFNLRSINLAMLDANGSTPLSVTFTGTLATGGTVSQTFTLNPTSGQAFFPFDASFTNLTKVEWVQASPFHQFDNIVVDPVNFAGITINDSPNVQPVAATPYPSTMTVSGMAGSVTDVNVSLFGLTHDSPRDVDILLVSPDGQKMILMSDVSNGQSIQDVNLTFDDSAAQFIASNAKLQSGTYKPTDIDLGRTVDTFPSPAPTGPYSSTLAAFNGSNANGIWSLYVVDDAHLGEGTITGWSLSIRTTADNDLPALTLNAGNVTVNEGSTATKNGTFSDFNNDAVTISASVGTISQQGTTSGTWSWSYTPDDGPSGSQTVTITATDSQGGVTTKTFQLTVNNVNPTATLNAPASVNEGDLFKVQLDNPMDPSSTDLASLHYSFATSLAGLATSYASADTSNSKIFSVPDNGTVTYFGRIFDKDGGVTTYSRNVIVNNVAPTMASPGNQTANEGASTIFNLGTLGDPGDDSPWAVHVNWGDGTVNDFQIPILANIGAAHTYADNGAYTVTVTATDKDGATSTPTTFRVDVANRPPTATGMTNGGPINEGSNVPVSLTGVSDPSSVDSTSLRYSFSITTSALAPSYVAATPTNQGVFHFTDNGSYTVYGRVYDKDGGISATFSTTVVVNNVAPTATFNAPSSANEGAPFTVSLTNPSDPSTADVAATFHYSFATSTADLANTYAAAGTSNSAALSLPDNGTFTVYGRIFDKDGGFTDYSRTVTINDVAPVLTAPGNQVAAEGSFTIFNLGSLADPGQDNPWTIHVTWGDSTSSDFQADAAGNLGGPHTYADSGTYTVTITATDKDGVASNTVSFQANVVNLVPTATGMTNNGPINEGSAVTVSLTGVSDPSTVDAASLHYSFATSTAGLALDYAAASATNQGSIVLPDNGTFTVYGRVYDKDGGQSAIFSTTVVVNNVAPTVDSFTSSTTGVGTGSPLTFQAAASDPGALDSFTYQFDWNYNGTTFNVQDTVGPVGPSNRSPVTITHAYMTEGTYRPAVRVLDKDGGVSAVFLAAPIQVGAVFLEDGNLIVMGTSGADNITVDATNPAAVRVTRNSSTYNFGPFNLSAGGRIIVHAGDGADIVSVNGPVSAEIFGGNGNDFLYGGSGNDILWGEAGDDYLTLGSGDDVGIGGTGKDQIFGGNGNDMLLGGHVDASLWSWAQLQQVVSDWNTWTNTGTPPSSLTSLRDATTDVADTANVDRFWGNTGKDLFIYRSGTGGDQVNSYSLTEKDYLLALL